MARAPAVHGYRNNPWREGWGRGPHTTETRSWGGRAPPGPGPTAHRAHLGPAGVRGDPAGTGPPRLGLPGARVRGARTVRGPQAPWGPGSPAGRPCPTLGAEGWGLGAGGWGGGARGSRRLGSRRWEPGESVRTLPFPTRAPSHRAQTGRDSFTPQPSGRQRPFCRGRWGVGRAPGGVAQQPRPARALTGRDRGRELLRRRRPRSTGPGGPRGP